MDDINTVILKSGGTYCLTRTRDGAGGEGPELISFSEPEDAKWHHNMIEDGHSQLKKGNWTQVGANMFRCTPITEFLEIEKDDDGDVVRVLFRTLNSEYEVRVI